MAVLLIWFFLLLRFNGVICGVTECAPGLNVCAETMADEIATAGSDTSLVCQAVDKSLACVVMETASCDMVSKAEIAGAMNSFIDKYEGSEYNCTLANADDPAFKTDACASAVSYCSNFYFEAEMTTDFNVACTLFDQYFSCMTTNTTACVSTDAVSQIKNAVDNTRSVANAEFYFCDERKLYSLDVCNRGFDSCVAPISKIGNNGQSCQIVNDMTKCVEELTAQKSNTCSPRQKSQYRETVKSMSKEFMNNPDLCNDALCLRMTSFLAGVFAVLAYTVTVL